MKKRLISLFAAALLLVALAGCGEERDNTLRDDGNASANSGAADNGGTSDDALTDSDSRSRSAPRYSSRSSGDDDFADNHGSTFGGAGEQIQEDADSRTGTAYDAGRGRQANGAATWRQMLENGFVHDSDGFLLDGENSSWS